MRTITLLLALMLSAGVVRGQERPLNPWNQYSPRERYDALRHYRQHEKKPESNRRKIERQYKRWQNLPESERNRIRQNYERYRNLEPQEREIFRQKYERWKRTPRSR